VVLELVLVLMMAKEVAPTVVAGGRSPAMRLRVPMVWGPKAAWEIRTRPLRIQGHLQRRYGYSQGCNPLLMLVLRIDPLQMHQADHRA